MKPIFWHNPSRYLAGVRIAVTGALLFAAAGLVFTAAKLERHSVIPASLTYHKKVQDTESGPNKAAVFSDFRQSDYNPAVEAYLLRAYPAAEVSGDATVGAWNGWASVNGNKHSPGVWQLLGPSQASVPGGLNALGDGAPYITAGRVTALALARNCTEGKCRL